LKIVMVRILLRTGFLLNLLISVTNCFSQVNPAEKLPLIITESKYQNPEAPVALLISGDGGWYGFEQKIADNLALSGIPTVGLDARKYFWDKMTPEQTTADTESALRYYAQKWGRKSFVLIGYSQGAEIVPFIATRISGEMKSKTLSVVMLSPESTTDFEVHFSNMLGMGNSKNTFDVIAEIKKIVTINTVAIFGEGEKSEVPAKLSGTTVKCRLIPGDHHYKTDLPLIIKTLKESKAF
jgi:type IV secretory pathway VirJ component